MSEASPDTTPDRSAASTRSIAADAAASVGGRIVAMVASSVTGLIIIANLDKTDYGAYALAVGLAGILAITLDLGTTSSLSRFLAQGRATRALFGRVVGVRAALLVVAGLAVAGAGLVANGQNRFVDLLPAAALVLVAQGLVSVLYGTLPAMRRIRLLVTITVLQPLAELGGVLWAHARDGDAAQMLLASAGASALAALVGHLALGRNSDGVRVKAGETLASVRDVLEYGRRLIAVLVLMLVFGQIDQFVIAAFHSAATVAPYAVAVKLQALLVAPVIAATGIIAPRIASARAEGATTYRRWLALFMILYAGACAVFAVLSKELFTAINPDYRGDSLVLVAMLPFIFLSAIANLPSVTLNQVGYAGSRVRIAAVSLAADALLDLALVPSMRAYGAAIATTVAFGYYTWAHHRLLEPVLGEAAGQAPPPIAPLLAKGGVLVALMAALAWVLGQLADGLVDGQRASAVVVVVIAAGIPAVLHLFATSRLVRRGMPDEVGPSAPAL